MQSFLEKLVDELLTRYPDKISGLCVVFPSRRAGIYFRNYLSQKLSSPVWSPDIYSIEDFVSRLSPYATADKLTLIFELYEAYKIYGENESFDRFYPWGEMILRDFDEIDKNLAPAEYIFRVIKEFKDVDEEFGSSLDDLSEFKEFWETFSNRDLTDIEREFIKTWEILGKVYPEFKKRLSEKNLAYQGMSYRKFYEDVKTKSIELPWEKLIFAGFNMLSASEEGIVKELIKQEKAEIYWDSDEYYVNDPKQEAGKFLRQSFKNLKSVSPNWVGNYLSSGELKERKNIKVIGATLQVGQAKALGDQLRELVLSDNVQLEKTAVILPDETLLMPVLYSIPGEVHSMNVTMGFPVRDTPLYSLIELLRALQSNKRTNGDVVTFYHRDVIQLVMHPYVKFFDPAFIYELVNYIKRNNIIHISPQKILGRRLDVPPIMKSIFTPVEDTSRTFEYLYGVLDIISEKVESSADVNTKFEVEYFYSVYEQLNHLKDIIAKYSTEMPVNIFWNLVLEVLRSIRVPFTGEPLKGLQIMGLLETRALDFDNIFILSMNEGILPRGFTQSSFIPYNLRKAFKLPVYEDEDAIPAYYFYRLLQRAKNIYLFYNTEVGNFSAGEKSRFLLQIENELVKQNSSINYEHIVLESGLDNPPRREIIISKNGEIIDKLKNAKYFSASDLINYITCSLKFYLTKLAGLKEEEKVEEFFSPSAFGNIFHKIAQLVYQKYIGVEILADEFDNIAKNMSRSFDEMLHTAFSTLEGFKEIDTDLQGKNLLFKGVIKKLLNKLLESDKLDAPFKITALEKELEDSINVETDIGTIHVNLHGRIDRIDETTGGTRIIDYKTGIVKVKNKSTKKPTEEYFEKVFSDVEYKESFQGYFYAYLYTRDHPARSLNMAIYPLRNMGSGINYFNKNSSIQADLGIFEENLKQLLKSILDKNIPFTQTEDEKVCRYCAFKSICYRD
jgi:CRISPR/Cas system-associated exonuclease Cas4 (RecB family)